MLAVYLPAFSSSSLGKKALKADVNIFSFTPGHVEAQPITPGSS